MKHFKVGKWIIPSHLLASDFGTVGKMGDGDVAVISCSVNDISVQGV
jgi:hypothetical protein